MERAQGVQTSTNSCHPGRVAHHPAEGIVATAEFVIFEGMNNSRVVIAVLAMVVSLFVGSGCERAADASAVRKTYAQWRLAQNQHNGTAYVNLITTDSALRYGELVKYALSGKKADLKKLEPADKLEILIMRVRGKKEELKKLDGPAYTQWHVEQGWAEFDIGVPEKIVDLRVDGDTANGELAYEVSRSRTPRFGRRGLGLLAGTSTTETIKTGIRYYFVRENGVWKVDEIASCPSFDADIVAAAREEGIDIDTYLEDLAAFHCDVDDVPASIWDKMPR